MIGKGNSAMVTAYLLVVAVTMVPVLIIGFVTAFLPMWAGILLGVVAIGGYLSFANLDRGASFMYFASGMAFILTLQIGVLFMSWYVTGILALVLAVVTLLSCSAYLSGLGRKGARGFWDKPLRANKETV